MAPPKLEPMTLLLGKSNFNIERGDPMRAIAEGCSRKAEKTQSANEHSVYLSSTRGTCIGMLCLLIGARMT